MLDEYKQPLYARRISLLTRTNAFRRLSLRYLRWLFCSQVFQIIERVQELRSEWWCSHGGGCGGGVGGSGGGGGDDRGGSGIIIIIIGGVGGGRVVTSDVTVF